MEIISLIVGIAGMVVGVLGLLNWRINLRRKYSWKDFEKAIKKVEVEIRAYNPDVVIGISDGMVPAAIIALNFRIPILHGLDIPVAFNEKGERAVKIYGDVGDISEKKVLVVDNHIYTGTNMKAAIDFLKMGSPKDIKTIALFRHTTRAAIFSPDFYADDRPPNEIKLVPWGFTAEHRQAYFRME